MAPGAVMAGGVLTGAAMAGVHTGSIAAGKYRLAVEQFSTAFG
jgi:hypothetical protein